MLSSISRNFKKFLSDKSGVTLTELLISVATLGVLSATIGVFLVQGMKFQRLTSAKAELQRDARRCIDLINRTLRQGQAETVIISRYNTSQPPCSMIEFTHINGNQYRFFQKNDLFMMGTMPSGETTWRENKIATNMRTLIIAYPMIDDTSILSVSICFEKATYEGLSKVLQLSVEKIRIMN